MLIPLRISESGRPSLILRLESHPWRGLKAGLPPFVKASPRAACDGLRGIPGYARTRGPSHKITLEAFCVGPLLAEM